MLKFYYNTGPNPMKVALFLEESGLEYEAIPVDTRRGDQHKDDYLKINPNAKAPTIIDNDITVFDSNAILLYLAEKTGKFLPENSLENKNTVFTNKDIEHIYNVYLRRGDILTQLVNMVDFIELVDSKKIQELLFIEKVNRSSPCANHFARPCSRGPVRSFVRGVQHGLA